MIRKIISVGNCSFVFPYELFSQTIQDPEFPDNSSKEKAGGFGSKFFDLWLVSGTLYFV